VRKIAIAAAVVLVVGGCAHVPQVNRTAKADKYAAPKTAKVEQPTPNQIVKKRWFPKYKIRWLHK
jgi:uncharacterized lipoprotein